MQRQDRSEPVAALPARRFPERPDFVGRLLRLAFMHMADELHREMALRYPGVTLAQSTVLILLDREGTRVGHLAARAQVNKQSMSELVAGLAKLGLVELRRDPSDGRARLVAPTDAGWAAMRAGLEVALALHHRWEQLLGAEKLGHLMTLLQELVDKLGKEPTA